jgi:short subunit dehydrogenase-like uncharacterized protein
MQHDPFFLLIYGSYGYTGSLITEMCVARKLPVVLAGRDEARLKAQSEATGFPYEVLALNETDRLNELLSGAKAVLHCAGPFRYTARPMVAACIENRTHYIDITGEFQVFEWLAQYHSLAVAQFTQVLPGAGFDVVPTDCLAAHLKSRLPDATHLQLAFASVHGGISRGTAKTMAEGAGTGSWVRRNGVLQQVPLGKLKLKVNFGPFESTCLNIPWGDISTAWQTTGIPNIEVYAAATPAMLRGAPVVHHLGRLLRVPWVKQLVQKQIDRRPAGPSAARRQQGRSYLWGKVWNAAGESRISKLETPDGYTLTARASVAIAEKILNGRFTPGCHTPASAYGKDFILKIAGASWVDE